MEAKSASISCSVPFLPTGASVNWWGEDNQGVTEKSNLSHRTCFGKAESTLHHRPVIRRFSSQKFPLGDLMHGIVDSFGLLRGSVVSSLFFRVGCDPPNNRCTHSHAPSLSSSACPFQIDRIHVRPELEHGLRCPLSHPMNSMSSSLAAARWNRSGAGRSSDGVPDGVVDDERRHGRGDEL